MLHYFLEFTHVHQVDGAIQTSHPLSPASPPARESQQNQMQRVQFTQLLLLSLT